MVTPAGFRHCRRNRRNLFSANPENRQAGIIDLWAANLLTGILSRADKGQPQIQCLPGRSSMRVGVLKSDPAR